jgi:hypothetical protein
MKLIPSQISPATKSGAERKIFGLLERIDLGPHAVALHSLNLPSHVYKRMGEIDFVVLTPECLLVCEVKGGRLRRREEDGFWEYIDRSDRVHESPEGPFAQARSAMWSLVRELQSRLPRRLSKSINFGYCVITPDVPWTVDSVDEPKELVIDEVDLEHGLADALRRLQQRWAVTGQQPPLAPDDWRHLRSSLRPTFDLVPSLHHRAKDAREQFEQLTESQYIGLDWVEKAPRLMVAGGAGTGKTMLAAEIARRDSRRGRVLLTCQSPTLAAYLAGRVDIPGVDVMSIGEARASAGRGRPWDIVVLDEAQDIFTDDCLDVLDELVVGGAQDGAWRLFYDVNNQAGLYGQVDDGLLELLSGTGAGQVLLRRNCRNAKSVVLYAQTLTGADLGQPLAGVGPRVRTDFPVDRDEEVRLLEAELARLAAESVVASGITILSFEQREASVLQQLPRSLTSRIRDFDATVAARVNPLGLTFAHIDDFKGFENDFILVTDLSRLEGDRADAARLYIALSRARYGMWFAVPRQLKKAYEAIREKHLPDVLAALEEQVT